MPWPVTLLRIRSPLSLSLRWTRPRRRPPVFLVLFVFIFFVAYWLAIPLRVRSILGDHSLILYILSLLLPPLLRLLFFLHILLSPRLCIFPPFIPVRSPVVIRLGSYHPIFVILNVSACLHQFILLLPLILFPDHFLLWLIGLPVPGHQFWHALRKVHLDSPVVNQYVVHLQISLFTGHGCFELDKRVL